MKQHDTELDEHARARLAFVAAGLPPVSQGPRRAEDGSTAPQPEPWQEAPTVDGREDHDDSGAEAVRERQPGGSAGRATSFVRLHLRVVVLVLLVGVLGTAALLMRGRATSMALDGGSGAVQPSAAISWSGGPAPSEASRTPPPAPSSRLNSSSAPTVQVHVVGAVREPGVVALPAGARVADAVRAAGGMTHQARPGDLNLAAPLPDGAQVVIGDTDDPGGEVRPAGRAGEGGSAEAIAGGAGASDKGSHETPASSSAAQGAGRQVNLNTATSQELDGLPGVGPVTAQRILDWREQHGGFTRVEDLQDVDGIGPKTYANLAASVTV